ncbi:MULTISPECIES: hypothetical protein [Vibrio]|uniref:hypothetical protein n=1 Tax=Vibrio TaxID=662 RepID=UPI002075FFD9|nr:MULTISPECIES: hypothetical protein [Vibrio]USD35469.1 hypothetical protein J8Z27_22890 [Vibrio sp. SCSIO 43186]USD72593.1 hypothetical protein J4N41_22895 [Vibrio sp. SCSIO 43139]USD98985.1 hypothetical protein CTT30_23210 [Vibrio coralliilyticus]
MKSRATLEQGYYRAVLVDIPTNDAIIVYSDGSHYYLFDRTIPIHRLDPDALILDTAPLPLADVTCTSIPFLTGESLSIPNSCIAEPQQPNTESLGLLSRFTHWWLAKVYLPLSSRYCRGDSMESVNHG